MDFLRDRFILGDLVQEGAVRSYRAHEIHSGREVLIHVDAAPAINSPLRSLAKLSPDSRQLILDQGQSRDSYYAVTPDLPFLHKFSEWLQSQVPASTARSDGKDDSFTASGLFAVDPQLARAADLEGKTRVFTIPPPQQKSPPPVADPAQNAVQPKPSDPEPGEFTRLFQEPAATPKQTSPPPVGSTPEPPVVSASEFTRFIRLGSPPQPLPPESRASQEPEQPKAAAPPPQEKAAQSQGAPGEFTRLMQSAPESRRSMLSKPPRKLESRANLLDCFNPPRNRPRRRHSLHPHQPASLHRSPVSSRALSRDPALQPWRPKVLTNRRCRQVSDPPKTWRCPWSWRICPRRWFNQNHTPLSRVNSGRPSTVIHPRINLECLKVRFRLSSRVHLSRPSRRLRPQAPSRPVHSQRSFNPRRRLVQPFGRTGLCSSHGPPQNPPFVRSL
jgi:hypothetical protein